MSTVYRNTILGIIIGAMPKLFGHKTMIVEAVGGVNLLDILFFNNSNIDHAVFFKPSFFDDDTESYSRGYKATFSSYSDIENDFKLLSSSIGIAQAFLDVGYVSKRDLQFALAPACFSYICELFTSDKKTLELTISEGNDVVQTMLLPWIGQNLD